MASTHKSLRSSTANKRPTTAIADGQIALNTNSASPGLFFKNSTGATIIKIGPVHVGTTAPNATPGTGGSSGNSTGEIWLDTSLTPVGVKIWNGSAFVNATPVGSTTVQGLLELATNAETQTGTDVDRAVTPAGLQSKLSDSTSTTSSSTIASSTAVKAAYDLAALALPKTGGTVTGNLEIGTTGTLSFEGATADAFETTIAVVDPTADRTITLPNVTGTVVTTGDTGTVTSTMLMDGTILNADVNASAAIAGTKINPDFGSQNTTTTGTSTAARLNVRKDSTTSTPAGSASIVLSNRDSSLASGNMAGGIFADMYRDIANPAYAAGIWFNRQQAVSGLDSGGEIVFGANAQASTGSAPVERARLDSSGKLLVGTSSTILSNEAMAVYSAAGSAIALQAASGNTNGTPGIFFKTIVTTGTAHVLRNYFDGTGDVGGITITTAGTQFNTTSDYRLKKNIVPLVGAIDRVNQLQVRRFNFLSDPNKTFDGFIAHEAQSIVPECITGEKDAVDDEGNPIYQGIDQSKLVPLLTAALQEALAKIATLEQRLTDAGIA